MRRRLQRTIPDDFAARAPGMKLADIQREFRIGKPKAQEWLERIGDRRYPRDKKPMPAGFAEAAQTMGATALERKFGLTRYEVTRMRKELGCFPAGQRKRFEIPSNFAQLATTMSNLALGERYGVSPRLVGKWRARMGIATPPPRYYRDGSIKLLNPRARSTADLAADHLRRIAPVYRCTVTGAQRATGDHWRFGNIILTTAEMMARAERKGWRRDAWQEVAQS